MNKKVPKAKPKASKSTASDSIGFLRAAEKAQIAVGEVPLNFFIDLGLATDKMKSAKKMNRKIFKAIYEKLEHASDAIPTEVLDSLLKQLKKAMATDNKSTKSKATVMAAKPASKPASKAVAPKPKAKAKAKPAASKAKAKAKPKAKAKTKTKAKAKPKAKTKAKTKTGTRTRKA